VQKLGDQIWPNSTDGVPHPSIFVKKNNTLKVGDLVYVQRNPQGIVTMLRTVSMPRIPYVFPREKFLPGYLKRCDKYDTLCPACRVFGWTSEKPQENEKRVAYSGRVRFSHGKLICNNGSMPDTPLAILSMPKPTTTPFYLVNSKGEPDLSVDYDTPDAKLRGRKFYRHHGKEISDGYISPDRNRSDQNRTVRGALKPGAQFEFSLDFENLASLELGAIIYALELEEGMFHRLGYAKPLGFGSIRVIRDCVEMIDWNERLNSLELKTGWSPVNKKELKDIFLKYMQDNYKGEFDRVLCDLRTILSEPSELPIHYPRPTKELNKNRPQFEWFMANKRLGKDGHALDLAIDEIDDTRGLPLIGKK
jgi:CRISPR-associated protein (TIGR03986 family)